MTDCICNQALCSQYFCQLLFIVGSGVYPRDIAAVVGGESIASWPASSIVILTAAFAPPIAQAADYWVSRFPSCVDNGEVYRCLQRFQLSQRRRALLR